MNHTQMVKRSQALLRAAGAVPVRSDGSHQVWRMPSGRIFPIQLHAGVWSRSPRGWKNLMTAIRRLVRSEKLRVERVP